MKEKLIQNEIAVKPSPIHGVGVFAEKSIKKGDIVEECYLLLTDGNEKKLENYYFEVEGQTIFLTGFGSLYNHSDQPNVSFFFDLDLKVAVFRAEQFIHAGEELLISYGTGWFSARNMEIAKDSNRSKKFDLKLPFLVRVLFACITAVTIVQLLSFLK